MSFECMAWAVNQTTGKMANKAVLLALANRTNHENGMCRPRIKVIAKDIEASEETVKRALKELTEGGLLIVVPRFFEGARVSNDYKLNMQGVGAECTQGGVGQNPTQGGLNLSPGWAHGDTAYNQEDEPGIRTNPPSPPRGEAPKGAGREKAQELVDLWNEAAKDGPFPKGRLTTPRAGIFSTRLKDPAWEEDFKTALAWMKGSPAAEWYRGKNDRGWIADLDFILQNGRATELAEKASVMNKAPEKAPEAELPKWKTDRIAMKTLAVETAKRAIRNLEAQGFTRATFGLRFRDADRSLATAEAELKAELGGGGAESPASASTAGRAG